VSLEDRVQAVCATTSDSRDLRRKVLDIVRAEVSVDGYVWLLTDPETTVGSSALADVPAAIPLPEAIRLKYRSEVHRWTTLTPGRVVSLAARPAGVGSPEHTWQSFLTAHGVDDVASSVFADRSGCWAFLDLWRSEGVFAAAELRYLESALAPVTAALRRCQALTFTAPGEECGFTEPAVLLLSPTLEVRHQTESAERHLRALLPTERDRQPVPATAYNVAAQLLAVEAGVDAHPPFTRVAIGSGHWCTFRAARLDTASRASADIAVTIERTSPRERLRLYCLAHDLTEREAQVVACLADGDDTRTVARRLHLSQFTVQDHLKSTFAKTGVRSRRALLAVAAG